MSLVLPRGFLPLSSNLQLCCSTGRGDVSAEEHGIDIDCRLLVERQGDTASLAPGDGELNAVGQGIACVCEDTVRLARAHCAHRDTKPILRPSGLLTEPLLQGKNVQYFSLKNSRIVFGTLEMRLATNENDVDAAQPRCSFPRDTLNGGSNSGLNLQSISNAVCVWKTSRASARVHSVLRQTGGTYCERHSLRVFERKSAWSTPAPAVNFRL